MIAAMGRGESHRILYGDPVFRRSTPERAGQARLSSDEVASLSISPRMALRLVFAVELELGIRRDAITESLLSRLIYSESVGAAIELDRSYQASLSRALARCDASVAAGKRFNQQKRQLYEKLFPNRSIDDALRYGICVGCDSELPWDKLSGRSTEDGYLCAGCGGVLG